MRYYLLLLLFFININLVKGSEGHTGKGTVQNIKIIDMNKSSPIIIPETLASLSYRWSLSLVMEEPVKTALAAVILPVYDDYIVEKDGLTYKIPYKVFKNIKPSTGRVKLFIDSTEGTPSEESLEFDLGAMGVSYFGDLSSLKKLEDIDSKYLSFNTPSSTRWTKLYKTKKNYLSEEDAKELYKKDSNYKGTSSTVNMTFDLNPIHSYIAGFLTKDETLDPFFENKVDNHALSKQNPFERFPVEEKDIKVSKKETEKDS